MATGVQSTPPTRTHTGTRSSTGGPAGKQSWIKKNKWVVIGGGAIGGVLLLSHKGGGTPNQTDPNAQLQAPGGFAPQQSGTDNTTPASTTDTGQTGDQSGQQGGGGGGGDGGGGSGSPTDSGNTITTGDITTNTVDVSGHGRVGTINQSKAKPGRKKTTGKGSGAGKTGTGIKKTTGGGRSSGGKAAPRNAPGRPQVLPKTAPRGRPAPASSGGSHPSTAGKTSRGTRKRSPALVESIHGAGSGQVVMGREFPGAIAHRLGPPQQATDGTVCRVVTVDYGGHTDRHMVHNNGERWTDNCRGMNPPGRGVQIHTDAIPV